VSGSGSWHAPTCVWKIAETIPEALHEIGTCTLSVGDT